MSQPLHFLQQFEKLAEMRAFGVGDAAKATKQPVQRYSQPSGAAASTRPDLVVPQKNLEPPVSQV